MFGSCEASVPRWHGSSLPNELVMHIKGGSSDVSSHLLHILCSTVPAEVRQMAEPWCVKALLFMDYVRMEVELRMYEKNANDMVLVTKQLSTNDTVLFHRIFGALVEHMRSKFEIASSIKPLGCGCMELIDDDFHDFLDDDIEDTACAMMEEAVTLRGTDRLEVLRNCALWCESSPESRHALADELVKHKSFVKELLHGSDSSIEELYTMAAVIRLVSSSPTAAEMVFDSLFHVLAERVRAFSSLSQLVTQQVQKAMEQMLNAMQQERVAMKSKQPTVALSQVSTWCPDAPLDSCDSSVGVGMIDCANNLHDSGNRLWAQDVLPPQVSELLDITSTMWSTE
eukprot:gnl/TRDRNA2_/TRDRNA2_206626_c0_seq1.p1 gnl/TRDRNA2_/TRDRNA2_206626_c0~~gnl/TRDRNA2_/TRDRNA2_206626_c0_seq1.p1  ORF type:complete len:341 (-),score=77.34 gnl/TRDRNA2_/TRDRNA2_206626_c0_seq1:78-1100(-)